MDFCFTPEQEAFRQHIRDFLAQELPPGWQGPRDGLGSSEEDFALGHELDRKLAGKGWLAMAWPKEYGGQGRSYVEQAIFKEELAYHRAPRGDQHGIPMVGPTIMIHGTEEQKRRYLGPIARAEMIWCQGFTEPGSGSDVASLQTRAVAEGDHYVVNGQKIFTTNAHHADMMFLAARTDTAAPKHRGISTFALNMRAQGVSVRPLRFLSGARGNEVFFSDVKLPRDALIGPENMGWYQMAAAVAYDRSGIDRVAGPRRAFADLLGHVKGTQAKGLYRENAQIRHSLVELAIELEVGRLLAYRVAWLQDKGLVPSYETSISKVFASELEQRVARVGVQVMGLYGLLEPGCVWAPLGGRIENTYLHSVSKTIGGGTSEIQRLVIATRGLGLPR